MLIQGILEQDKYMFSHKTDFLVQLMLNFS